MLMHHASLLIIFLPSIWNPILWDFAIDTIVELCHSVLSSIPFVTCTSYYHIAKCFLFLPPPDLTTAYKLHHIPINTKIRLYHFPASLSIPRSAIRLNHYPLCHSPFGCWQIIPSSIVTLFCCHHQVATIVFIFTAPISKSSAAHSSRPLVQRHTLSLGSLFWSLHICFTSPCHSPVAFSSVLELCHGSLYWHRHCTWEISSPNKANDHFRTKLLPNHKCYEWTSWKSFISNLVGIA